MEIISIQDLTPRVRVGDRDGQTTAILAGALLQESGKRTLPGELCPERVPPGSMIMLDVTRNERLNL
jgi:hypothetical protein